MPASGRYASTTMDETPSIEIQEDGPYRVRGATLVRTAQVETELHSSRASIALTRAANSGLSARLVNSCGSFCRSKSWVCLICG